MFLTAAQVQVILAAYGLGDRFDPAGEYFVRSPVYRGFRDGEGRRSVYGEELWKRGDTEPVTMNYGSVSWLSTEYYRSFGGIP